MNRRFLAALVIMLLTGLGFFLLLPTKAECKEFTGGAQVNLTYDNNGGDNLTTEINYLGLGVSDNNYAFYGLYDFENGTIDLLDAYVKFGKSFVIQGGSMVRPFGINYLDRAESSVFLTVPKYDVYENGLQLSYVHDYFVLDGFYSDDDTYDFRGKFILFDEGIIPSLSYNAEEHWLVSNELYYESLVLNFSNLLEWDTTTGAFWTRFVVSPGIINQVGLICAYYNTLDENLIPNYDFRPDAWTVGAYLDVSDDATLTYEYKVGQSLTPMMFGLKAKF